MGIKCGNCNQETNSPTPGCIEVDGLAKFIPLCWACQAVNQSIWDTIAEAAVIRLSADFRLPADSITLGSFKSQDALALVRMIRCFGTFIGLQHVTADNVYNLAVELFNVSIDGRLAELLQTGSVAIVDAEETEGIESEA